jgi:outer membrane protein OmpA-like peptidoglycan-associated protein
MTVEARNLPEMPATGRLEEGRAENRRVEIRSGHPAILDLVRSTYIATDIDARSLTLRPTLDSAYGIARWRIAASAGGQSLAELAGEGNPAAEIAVPLRLTDLKSLAAAGSIPVVMELEDRKGQTLKLSPAPLPVRFIETRERLAQKQEYRVQEKYALILFDFDSAALGEHNQAIVGEIVARIRELPEASVAIVGHTDTIGTDDYNLKLSERRAKAVYDQVLALYGEDAAGRISQKGVGEADPLYDNLSPEARSFNRTVAITLEYMAKE